MWRSVFLINGGWGKWQVSQILHEVRDQLMQISGKILFQVEEAASEKIMRPGACITCWRNSKEASMAGAERSTDSSWGWREPGITPQSSADHGEEDFILNVIRSDCRIWAGSEVFWFMFPGDHHEFVPFVCIYELDDDFSMFHLKRIFELDAKAVIWRMRTYSDVKEKLLCCI